MQEGTHSKGNGRRHLHAIPRMKYGSICAIIALLCSGILRHLARAMTEAPVGEWISPITSELITSSSIRLGNARPGRDGYIYWLEARPSEGGRSVLVRQ